MKARQNFTAPFHDRPDAEATKQRNVKDSIRKKENQEKNLTDIVAILKPAVVAYHLPISDLKDS
jgi:hypothetical protein